MLARGLRFAREVQERHEAMDPCTFTWITRSSAHQSDIFSLALANEGFDG